MFVFVFIYLFGTQQLCIVPYGRRCGRTSEDNIASGHTI